MSIETSIQPSNTKPQPWMWVAAVVVLGLAGASLMQPRSKAPQAAAGQPAASVAPSRARNTTDLELAQLIARLNRFTSATMGSKYLLPTNPKEEVRNDVFHTYALRFPTAQIGIEAENTTGRPFSITLISTATTNTDIAESIGLMAAIGATMLGKGPQAGALMNACTAAAESTNKSHTVNLGDFTVFCSKPMGAWVAGISVSKEASISSGIAAVPMQPDAK